MMSADEGHILPHTDSAHKLVTIVIPILKEDEWNKNWGEIPQSWNQLTKK